MFRSCFVLILSSLAVAGATLPVIGYGQATISKAEVVQRGKPSTAMIEVDRRSFASAFCVHSSGLFVTNSHVFESKAASSIKIVLNAGTEQQKVLAAKLVRKDKELDLALVSAPEAKGTKPIPIRQDDKIHELMDVVVFGFPFGRGLATSNQKYPSISINKGSVSSLRKKNGKLFRIQLDAAVNPGNSGGPILDMKGEVMAVVVGRVESRVGGAGVDLAIPANHLRDFLNRPEVDIFVPDEVKENEKAEFRAQLAFLVESTDKLSVELEIIGADGELRSAPMEGSDGVYKAEIVPFPSAGNSVTVELNADFANGSIKGITNDRALQVSGTEVKLSDILAIMPTETKVELINRTTKSGEIKGLKAISLLLGAQQLSIDLSSATKIQIKPLVSKGTATCAVVVRQGGAVLLRKEALLYAKGTQRPSLDAIKEDRFIRPPRSNAVISYMKVQSSQGDYIGQGRSYQYDGKAMAPRWSNRGIQLSVDGWSVNFSGPSGKTLIVDEYPNAKRHPFNDSSPGLSFSGKGRGCNRLAGKFVIWELEVLDNKVTRLAIDFIQRCEEKGPPLCGMIRYNSHFQ